MQGENSNLRPPGYERLEPKNRNLRFPLEIATTA
jgi:hypothetical protein